MATKVADSKGRIALGRKYANTMFIVTEESGRFIIEPGVVVPEREAWLYENQSALESVRRGLQQAKDGRFSKTPPDIDADDELTAELED